MTSNQITLGAIGLLLLIYSGFITTLYFNKTAETSGLNIFECRAIQETRQISQEIEKIVKSTNSKLSEYEKKLNKIQKTYTGLDFNTIK